MACRMEVSEEYDADFIQGSVQSSIYHTLLDTMAGLKGLGQAAIMLPASVDDGMFNYYINIFFTYV